MKVRISGFLRGAICAAGILIGAASTALAHSMPSEEGMIILPKPPYGQLEIVPHESTLSDVCEGFGYDFEEEDFASDGMRFVSYRYGESIIFFAYTGELDTRPSGELKIAGYDVLSGSLHTPSDFCVGKSYQEVVDMYGEASDALQEEPGITSYIYVFEGQGTELIFDVDAGGIICAIRYRSEL